MFPRRWPAALAVALVLSGCAADTIGDRRPGQVVVCHDGRVTLAVSNADSFVHLDHGDTMGPCPAPRTDRQKP